MIISTQDIKIGLNIISLNNHIGFLHHHLKTSKFQCDTVCGAVTIQVTYTLFPPRHYGQICIQLTQQMNLVV